MNPAGTKIWPRRMLDDHVAHKQKNGSSSVDATKKVIEKIGDTIDGMVWGPFIQTNKGRIEPNYQFPLIKPVDLKEDIKRLQKDGKRVVIHNLQHDWNGPSHLDGWVLDEDQYQSGLVTDQDLYP